MRVLMFLRIITVIALLSVIGVGCKTKGTTGLTKIPTGPKGTAGSGGANTGGGNPNSLGPGNPGGNGSNFNGTNVAGNNGGNPVEPLSIPENYREQRNIFASVHFDYDSAELRPGDRDLIVQVAQHLLQNPAHMLLVEGHCDERGTEEYNLSLGERRALSVAEELARMGVTVGRLGTQSFGEKVPLAESNAKESLAKNRRGEFVLFMPMAGVVELPQ